MAGFETLPDGSTRVFVELSKPAAYDAKVARLGLIYVLKDTHVDRRNNRNPLVTVHFNTPVTSARLTPHGRDLWLVIDLRASVQPAATMGTGKDGEAVLRLDFPKGSYLPAEAAPPAQAPTPPEHDDAAQAPPASSTSAKSTSTAAR